MLINEPIEKVGLAYHIRDKNGSEIVYSDTAVDGMRHIPSPQSGEIYCIELTFKVNLHHGPYTIASMASIPGGEGGRDVSVAYFVPVSCELSVFAG